MTTVTMEMFSLGASGWADGGATEVQEKALALQKENGFEDSRNALSITIRYACLIDHSLICSEMNLFECFLRRAWFMRAFIEEKFTGDPKPSVELYRKILSVLDWGLKTWPGVPNSVRGAIFNETFIRGMKRHYLNVYLAVRIPASLLLLSSLPCYRHVGDLIFVPSAGWTVTNLIGWLKNKSKRLERTCHAVTKNICPIRGSTVHSLSTQ